MLISANINLLEASTDALESLTGLCSELVAKSNRLRTENDQLQIKVLEAEETSGRATYTTQASDDYTDIIRTEAKACIATQKQSSCHRLIDGCASLREKLKVHTDILQKQQSGAHNPSGNQATQSRYSARRKPYTTQGSPQNINNQASPTQEIDYFS